MTTSDLDRLVTEAGNASAEGLDLRSTAELVQLLNREDATVAGAVAAAAPALAAAIDAIAARLSSGGRLVYVGAGTSGRLAALDAAECEATFSSPPGQVVALVAGAELVPGPVQDAVEDDAEAGRADLETLGVTAADAVVGVSASGQTPYVCGALCAAGEAGALTVAVVANESSELAAIAALEVATVVGPEVVAGSTRLKAGTAQKLVLNAISTIVMVRLGKTFGNLMVDVRPSNEKLRERQRRVVETAAGADAVEAEAALAAAEGDAKVAIVSLLAGVDAAEARGRLHAAGGNVRQASGR
jgi:N-acetylmuramic acid 6-phosphate etherase